MWFIGVEVEQETSAPPPKKNPGSAPDLTAGNKKSKETGRRKGLNPVLQIRNRMRQLVTRKKKPPPSNKI